MTTNAQMQDDVRAELTWDPSVHERQIGVLAADGVVTLTGCVPSYADKVAAEHAAERAPGVRAVANELTVALTPADQRSDRDIATAVIDTLAWDVRVPNPRIQAAVTNGWVTLEGTVDWCHERDAAAQAVQHLTGVRGVTNNITVAFRRLSAYDVARNIRRALEREADRTARRIHVDVAGGVVVLSGVVPTFAERAVAKHAASITSGVEDVHDELTVGG